ncbi:serine/threonine-protein phosphatase 1 regulatory subunit 10 [Aplysia californica]|uniref:Serine/threonine-protein phosphatase 1 regulatory subunit 10 n=1 Tax=Aplysia californica TaxID=6500 RepID=A0ABM0K550_APLCA|nr:serine/threonine-protein phosphatase 1 regulatory subunit 10 [Aplysia californica]XP_035828434.1 serine/threonine-protein phosphatase 1 regulatory subunit 10 [Aplysia californica]XP_035828435.1 serine/threonine-protein phosphatase 1 regulatory subunit 10 [Aplysia californica]
MPPIDPQQLLKALGPLLTNSGGIKGAQEASRIASLMKDATKLVSRCIYLNILRVTDSPSALEKFIEVGGWDTMNTWLDFSRNDSNDALLGEILQAYLNLPVSVTLLKKNSAAKTIKQLSKAENEKIKTLSSQLVDAWTKTIRGQNNKEESDDKKKKKKHKEKEREKSDKDKENDKKEREEKDSEKHKRSDKESKEHHHRDKDRKDRDRHKDKDRDKERSRDKSKSSNENNKDSTKSSSSSSSDHPSSKSKDPSSSSKKISLPEEAKASSSTPSVSTPAGTVPSSKTDTGANKEEESRRRPKTVKQLNTRFRSTGLFDEDDEDEVEPVKKKLDKPPIKRAGLEMRGEDLIEKKPRLQLTMPTLTPASVDLGNMTPPEVQHGRIKIIPPPKRAPAHEIQESNVFMDALQQSSYTHGPLKKKKKLTSPSATTAPSSLLRGSHSLSPPSATSPPQATSPPEEETGPTSPPLLSPTAAMAQKLPSVPSFYRDTLEDMPEPTEEKEDNVEEEDDGPPVVEGMDTSEASPPQLDQSDADISMEQSEGLSNESKESSENSSDKAPVSEGEQRVKSTKPKKSVSWARESQLEEYFYFELDETERENVNRPKSFMEMKKEEMVLDKRAMESAKRLNNDFMVEVLPWKRPKLIDDVIEVVEPGCNSQEKVVQTERERAVLCALFFNKVPDTPNEPDPDMAGEENDMKVIPLEDENGSCTEYEHTYNFDDPSSLPYDPEFGGLPLQNQGPAMNQGHMGMNNNMGNNMNANMGGGGGGANMGYKMPPALSHLLNTLRQQAQETQDPLMQNLQGRLTHVLQSTNPQDSGMLMDRILNALEPFKNQIPGLSGLISSVTNNGMDPNMGGGSGQGPRGMMGPNQMGNPRPHGGLLGSHPPGFNMMGPGNMRPNMQGGPNMPGPNMQGGPSMPGGPMMGNGGGNMNPNFYNRGPRPNMGEMRMGGPPQWRGGGRGRPFGKRGHKNSVCQHFVKKGNCRYGDGCQFIHPGPDS